MYRASIPSDNGAMMDKAALEQRLGRAVSDFEYSAWQKMKGKEPVPIPAPAPLPPQGSCAFLGDYANQTTHCGSCRGTVQLKVFHCGNKQMSGKDLCTIARPAEGFACCNGKNGLGCAGYAPKVDAPTGLQAPNPAKRERELTWAVGLTTVPARRNDLLPRTLASLKDAGFTVNRLFVDGVHGNIATGWEEQFGTPITPRWPAINVHGNWFLGLGELFTRYPTADRYAMFQDDFVAVRNLRAYLDKCKYPDNGYLNLLTFPHNEAYAPRDLTVNKNAIAGFYEASSKKRGLGAVALVFNRDACMELLGAQHMITRPTDATGRYPKYIDGGIVEGMNKAGYKEYVHYPSLVQHTGQQSTIGNAPHPLAPSFPGEQFDALSLIEGQAFAK